jgi:hypothetical protein
MSAKSIFEKLVNIAHGYSWHLSSLLHPGRYGKPWGKPGELLDKLSPEEREELKNLKSDDVKPDLGCGELQYMTDVYPENTTTVHSHSTPKKDSDE